MNAKTIIPFSRMVLILVSSSLLLSCTTSKNTVSKPPARESAPASFHLGSHSFPISTKVPQAQSAFNRGLTLSYAFSHKAAEREFRRAAEHDAEAAMPWWGVALVNGPHINYPLVPEDKARIAWEAITRARSKRAQATLLERDLIDALSARYVKHQPKDRSKLDRAYAAAMKKLSLKYPEHSDVTALYAEALMDLNPWNLWTEKGAAQPWTPEILSTLEHAIALTRTHPGAHHLYIHAVEGSNHPEVGVPSADLLGGLVPGAGHLVHMPGHVYIRIGRWEDAAKANENVILADEEFKKSEPSPGFYAIYMTHNRHFLSFVRMMQGRREAALKAAREMVAGVPPEFLKEYGPIADGYMAIVPEVQMRFGMWDEILSEPEPSQELPIARALRHFARISALNALDRRAEAKQERARFVAAVGRVPQDATFGNSSAHQLLKIALLVADGEMAAREQRYDAAIKLLTQAVKLEDALMYDEPPDWILPVRHALGITLLRAGKAKEAELAYREDLKKFPKNGWSLYGLNRSLALQKREQEAALALKDFKTQWAGADTAIEGSCLCQPGV